MPFEIQNASGEWTAVHAQGRCGGPRGLSVLGTEVLSQFAFKFNGYGDDMLHSKSKVYHKGGQTVFESDGRYPGGPALTQVCRYARNTMRVTWDLNWPKGAVPKEPVELGSCHLAGKWVRLGEVSADKEGGLSIKWTELKAGDRLEWGTFPLSMIFEREDGLRMEYSLGFDVWRWNYALGMSNSRPVTVEVAEDGLELLRRICDAGTELVFPEAREYRFMAVLAWSWKGMAAAEEPCEVQEMAVDGKNGMDMQNLDADKAILVDFGKSICQETVRRMGEDGSRRALCLEHKNAIGMFKRVVRQLSASSDTGHLILKGLTPGLCWDGSHCDKKGLRLHWDHQSLLILLTWAKSILKESWTVQCPVEGVLAELPSMAGLSLPNGFLYE